MAKGLPVKGVKHGVSGSVGGGGAAVRLSSLAVLERLSTKRTLIDLALGRAGEGQPVVLKLKNGSRCAGENTERSAIAALEPHCKDTGPTCFTTPGVSQQGVSVDRRSEIPSMSTDM